MLVGTLAVSNANASEKQIVRSDLPPAVEKTVAAHTSGAVVRGFSQEEENGKTLYEAELTVNGHSKDILIDAKGSVVAVEEEVPLASLPPSVQAGLKARAGNGRIEKVESITKHDRLVAYEARFDINGKKSEVQVGPEGKPLGQAE
jgi:hypothetical protein